MHHALSPALLRLFLQLRLRLHRRQMPQDLYTRFRKVCTLTCTAAEQEALAITTPMRDQLRQDATLVQVQDFGAGASTAQAPRSVASIYARAASPHAWALFLFRLVRDLEAGRILELGTNLGVAAAYLRLGLDLNGAGTLVTLEGDPTLASAAQTTLQALSPQPSVVVPGRFQDTLPDVLNTHGPFDLVFIDGHHEAEAAYRYVQQIKPYLLPRACIVLDDVEPWTNTVRPAWHRLCAEHPQAISLDLWKMGILRFPDYPSDAA